MSNLDLFLDQSLENVSERTAAGTGPSTCWGHARSWDRHLQELGTCPVSGQAFRVLGSDPVLTGPVFGQVVENGRDKLVLGAGP